MAIGSNPTVIFYVTQKGRRLAETIARQRPGASCLRFSSARVTSEWKKASGLIFIMASGIVVRTIAPLLRDKRRDPAVVVIDEKGQYIVSLVGGHMGGANELVREIARMTGGDPVITTASDVNNLPAIDLWADREGLLIENRKALARLGVKLVDTGHLDIFSDISLPLPLTFRRTDKAEQADILIANRLIDEDRSRANLLILRPRNLIAGIGCNSGTGADEIEEAIRHTLDEAHLSFLSLSGIATIDIKAEEPGLAAFGRKHDLPIRVYSPERLNLVTGVTPSPAARKATGAQAVAEPAAILGSDQGMLLVEKQRIGNVTVAIAQKNRTGTEEPVCRQQSQPKGMISVVGTGPGQEDYLTPKASRAIRDADAIVGYGPYLDLVRGLIGGKETVSTGMAQEMDRCRRAIELAAEGKRVAVISGGDPGIYAMAGLVLELLKKGTADISSDDVEIIPGISALNACAARLGAPLMHDFAAISLSDRLTPWQTIEVRIEAAARADFVIALYNPKSRGRRTHVERACNSIMKYRSPTTPVGIVRAAMREDETVMVTDLGNVPFDIIDMQTTVIVGNSRTEVWNGLMITPRGYEKKGAW
jgi:cobalt-precorrin 5A hydrolase/precorrin-3B C17-methyltransferase